MLGVTRIGTGYREQAYGRFISIMHDGVVNRGDD